MRIPPPAYGGCTCPCHKNGSVMHLVPCCRPIQETWLPNTTPRQDEAIASVADITARAEAMKIGMAAYPVAEIRHVLDALGGKA